MKYILFFVVTSITIVINTPFQFPDYGLPRSNRQIESRAYRKPNSNFNRLTLNRITVQDDDDIDDYDDTVVLPDNTPTSTASPTRTTTASTYASNNYVGNDQYDLDDEETDVLSDGSRRRRRRKPVCIPFQVPSHNNGGYYRNTNEDNSKTFGGITYINQHYNLNSGYGGGHDEQQDNHKPVNEIQQSPSHNQNPGYGCIPLYYGNHHGINRPHHRPPGRHFNNRPGGGFGGYGHRPRPGWYGSGNRPLFNGGNRPQGGGPFGFFGNGGLFDFSNLFGGSNGGSGGGGGGNNGNSDGNTSPNLFNRPSSSIQNNRPSVTYSPPTSSNNNEEIFSDSVSDDSIKPVFEINVPDTIQDVIYNVRPIVGGISNQVSGFIQQLATRPDQTVNRINREFNSFLRPIYNFF